MKMFTNITKAAATLLLAFGLFTQVSAQDAKATISKVATAIQAGDHAALGNHFNANVEVTVPGADNTYSSQQAAFVMKDFFQKYQPQKFEVMHQGNSGATYYATGSLKTARGNLDTNIFLKKSGEKYLITQIRFEAE